MNQIIRNAMLSNQIASVIISIALMLFLGFAMTRITKRLRLPNVTAYIITGILIGPYCADLIPLSVIDHMDFLPDIALAFIAFSTGEFFRLPVEFLFGSGNPGVTVNHKRVHLRRKYVSVIFSLQRCTFTDII